MSPRLPPLRSPQLLFAHRGARAHAPENTLEAFTLGLRLGANGLESDVWLTADGQAVLDHDGLTPIHPSEEHLPIRVASGARAPEPGSLLRLIPRHVCPTVNNFDHAVILRGGAVESVELVTARGHEPPLAVPRASSHSA